MATDMRVKGLLAHNKTVSDRSLVVFTDMRAKAFSRAHEKKPGAIRPGEV